jgi:hypothetical protein
MTRTLAIRTRHHPHGAKGFSEFRDGVVGAVVIFVRQCLVLEVVGVVSSIFG